MSPATCRYAQAAGGAAAASVLRLGSTDHVLPSPRAPEYSGEPRDRRRDISRKIVQITTTDLASAQRAHSKLQRPPHVRAPGSGAAAAATDTQWQERTAADVPRACSSKPPQGGFAAEPTDRRLLSACEGR